MAPDQPDLNGMQNANPSTPPPASPSAAHWMVWAAGIALAVNLGAGGYFLVQQETRTIKSEAFELLDQQYQELETQAKERREELNKGIGKLEATIENLEAQKGSLDESVSKLRTQNDSLESKRQIAQQIIDNKERAQEYIEQHPLEDYKLKVAEAKDYLSRSESKLQTYIDTIKAKKSELDSVDRELDELPNMQDLRKKVQDLENRSASAEAAIKKLPELETLRESVRNEEERLADAEAAIKKLPDLETLRENVRIEGERLADAKAAIRKLPDLNTLRGDVRDEEAKLADAEAKNAQLEGIEKRLVKMQTAEANAIIAVEREKQAKEDFANLQGTIEQREIRLDEVTKEIGKAEEKLRKLGEAMASEGVDQ